MHYYAQIDDGGIVAGITQASGEIDAPDMIAIPEYDAALIGQRYDRDASAAAGGPVFVPVPMPEQPLLKMTKLAFRNRFTLAEKTGVELASLDDPSAPMAQRAQAAAIRVYLADVAAATFIDPAREETRAGVRALEAAGLIGAGRALEILDAPIGAAEAFTG